MGAPFRPRDAEPGRGDRRWADRVRRCSKLRAPSSFAGMGVGLKPTPERPVACSAGHFFLWGGLDAVRGV